jgi:hypothetical protein
MKISDSRLLATTVFLAFAPWPIVLYRPSGRTLGCAAVLALIWVFLGVVYYRRVRTRRALWLFALLPVTFAPFIFILIGLLFFWHGEW